MRRADFLVGLATLAAGCLAVAPGAAAQAIAALPMSDTALIGRFARGPVDLPVRVGAAEFAVTFSSGNPAAWPAEIQAREFFANGGTSLYVVRVAEGIPLTAALLGRASDFTGVHAVETLSDLRLLIAPELSLLPAGDFATVLAGLRAYVEMRRIFLIVDPPPGIADANAMVAWTQASVPGDAAFCAVYYPSLLVQIDGTPLTVPPCGAMAAIYAQADSTNGIWRSPSGTGFPIQALGLSAAVNTTDSNLLNTNGINPIRQFTTIVPFGARTRDLSPSDTRYIPVVRARDWIAACIERGLAFAARQDDAEPLWSQIRTGVGNFLDGLWQQGAFIGSTAAHAYFVRCDATTTSSADVAAHQVNVLYGTAFLRSDEFTLNMLTALTLDSQRPVPVPQLQAHNLAGSLVLAFPTVPGFDYTLEGSGDLHSGMWLGAAMPVGGDGAWHSFVVPITSARGFSRLRIVPSP